MAKHGLSMVSILGSLGTCVYVLKTRQEGEIEGKGTAVRQCPEGHLFFISGKCM